MALEPAVEDGLESLEGGQYLVATYNFHGVTVRIRSDSQSAIASLDSVYSFFRVPGIAQPQLDMTLLANDGDLSSGKEKRAFARVPRSFDGWRTALLYRNGLHSGAIDLLDHIREVAVPLDQEAPSRLYHIRDLSDIKCWSADWVAGVEFLVFIFVMYHLHHLCAIHAGTVSRGERGLLLCGSTNSGKTVLSYALARNGFGYLSDEFGLFAPATLELFPFPRGISLRPEAARLFGDMGPVLEGKDVVWRQGKRHLMSLENLGVRVKREPVRAAFLFFVSHQASAVPSLKRMAPSDAAEKLAKSASLWLHAPQENWGFTRAEAAVRLCENAVCGELISGDLDRTVALITSVCDNGCNHQEDLGIP